MDLHICMSLVSTIPSHWTQYFPHGSTYMHVLGVHHSVTLNTIFSPWIYIYACPWCPPFRHSDHNIFPMDLHICMSLVSTIPSLWPQSFPHGPTYMHVLGFHHSVTLTTIFSPWTYIYANPWFPPFRHSDHNLFPTDLHICKSLVSTFPSVSKPK